VLIHSLTKVPNIVLGAVGCSVSVICSGVTPIGQGWTNARGLRGLGGPKPDPNFFVYFNISSVRCQPSILLYSWFVCERPTSIKLL